eukprot:3648494-Pyramimonas_sp.AAC.1
MMNDEFNMSSCVLHSVVGSRCAAQRRDNEKALCDDSIPRALSHPLSRALIQGPCPPHPPLLQPPFPLKSFTIPPSSSDRPLLQPLLPDTPQPHAWYSNGLERYSNLSGV